ncbi:energy transducer TonB [Salinimicrobium sediminilitoris]|uniref:energy transducer TonB n=1 Tax=Salinimicrobium sediminilitoris TaxID=2876715 RepID=UPI001E453A1D|nr:energy transducer TonB [Salinimicrobium sediminilitoris]MCC8358823.1 energy transducer TonB [Salinimicrobium sediminilitoris]
MNKLFTLALLFSVHLLTAQEKIYMDQNYENVTDPSLASYYKIEEKIEAGDADIIRKTFRMNDSISAIQYLSFKDGKAVNEGRHKFWYKTGEPFYEIEYKNGERHGELIARWKDGTKRRHDFFKKDKFKKGTVWNEKGEEIEHFPYWIPASFPGGNAELQTYLKNNLPIPEKQKRGTTVKVAVIFTINEEGIIEEVQVIDGAPRWYNAVAVQVLSNMPRWEPARFFGAPQATSFGLPISFVK